MSLVVEVFPDLVSGNYWFLIADAGGNGICCDHGQGEVRVVQATLSYQAGNTASGYIATVDEHVIFEHRGNFTDYAEVHFEI